MKSNLEIAYEVIAGRWGNGDERKHNLEADGYDYDAIQYLVNRIMKGEIIDDEPITPIEDDKELLVVNIDLKKYKGLAIYIEV